MRDVSAVAGVSVSTISHVINHTRPVPEPTRKRVLAAIETTGYTPNTLARSLKRAETRTIGLAIGDISNPYFTEVVHALGGAASAAGYTVILTDMREDPALETAALAALIGRRVDGLILAPSVGGRVAVAEARRRGVPLVQIDRVASTDSDYVVARNGPDLRRMVRHLAALGHRHMAMLSGIKGVSTSRERVHAFLAGLKESGLTPDAASILGAGFRVDSARRATHTLLDRRDRPSAIVAGNNLMALGAMRGLSERGVCVPEEIALVSFDDFEWADLFRPRLTTIAQPCARIGQTAMELLLSRIAEPDLPARGVRLPTVLRHRESCGCAPGAEFKL
jgi:LacI family transcriptional regulator, galactose operon repressor